MKNLIEISKIVTKRKVKKIEIFDDHSLKHKNSKFNEFYEALLANKFKNDRDAASYLYNCSPTDAKYRQLKSRFRKRLLNTLFFLDVNLPSSSNYDRAYFTCNKDWTLVKILQSNHAHHTSASLSKQILTIALKYRFADVIVNCSRILREYAALQSDEKSYDTYNEYISNFTKILEAELLSEELYQKVAMAYYQPPSKSQELPENIQSYCDQLVSLSENHESPVINYNMYLVWTLRYEMIQDFDNMIAVCENAEKYMEENPLYHQEEKLNTFRLKKMSAYLHLKDYKNGKVTAEKCLQSITLGSDKWFTFMEYYLLLAIHTENYINALAIFNQATVNSKFKKQDTITQEKWQVFEAFLNFIIDVEGKENPILFKQKRRTFKKARFLKDPILYPKDQRVFTILMIIAQTLFLVEQKSYNAIEERIERLKNYANRQLKKEEYFRAIQFIRLLQQLHKANYKVENLSSTEKYYENLKKEPFFFRGLLSELEIIPYEKLWEMLIAYLE